MHLGAPDLGGPDLGAPDPGGPVPETWDRGTDDETCAAAAARTALTRRLSSALASVDEPAPGLVVAFSGGPDSTALLLSASELASRCRLRLWAVHVDHRLDPDSGRRAIRAGELASRIGVELHSCVVHGPPRAGRSVEAEARRERYRLLEGERRRLGADWVATAHHRDDQLETLLLRIRQGSGMRGLQGIRSRFGRVLRPFLGTSREQLAEALGDRPDLVPVEDPTNRSMSHARNRVRRSLAPALAASEPESPLPLAALSARVAHRAANARRVLDSRLAEAVELRREPGEETPSLSTSRLLALPPALRQWSVALLSERSGEPYPPPARAVAELLRQLQRSGRARCDWSAKGRLEARKGRLRVVSSLPRERWQT